MSGDIGERAAPNIMATTPENQAATFRNQDQIWPHRVIARGEAVRPLPPHARSLENWTPEVRGVRVDLNDFMARRRTAGLLVLKNGEIALERYGMGSGAESRWTSFSAAKSMTATLAGAALHDGAIASLNDPCARYLPRMRGSAYADVTIQNLLRMCSGVAWDEGDKSDGDDIKRLGQTMARRKPGAILDLLCTLPRAHRQGAVFNYSTSDSCVLAAVVAAAADCSLADYASAKIWAPAGMEADGAWQLESEDGLALGGFGVSLRLRDAGRFGMFVLEDGAALDGRRILPMGWRDLAGQPDCAATAFGQILPGSPAGYGYHWWTLPGAPFADGLHAGAFMALGAYGQRIYINPARRVVVVIQSAWRQPSDMDAEAETVALVRAVLRAVEQ